MARPTISLVIPCHNEEQGLVSIFSRLPSEVDEVIVVDNNSTDRTTQVAIEAGAKVICEKRMGYGRCYKAGFAFATKDIIVAMDGDGTYPPEAICALVQRLVNGPYDFISCARFPLTEMAAMPFLNWAANHVLTLLFRMLTLKTIKDSQSGMWVFYRRLLSHMDLKSDGMPFSEEIKMEALLHKGIRFGEEHIPYADRLGKVKLKRWKDGFSNLVFLFLKRIELWQRTSSSIDRNRLS
jgi:dolichol-phosphate hexosyltransferase